MAKADLKTPAEIKIIVEGGQLLRQILEEAAQKTKPGVRLSEIEAFSWKKLETTGGKPGFAQVPGYQWATCININEGIVHGIPTEYEVKEGDLVTIDMGLLYKGFNTDTAISFQATTSKKFVRLNLENGRAVKAQEIERFLNIGEKTLEKAIAQAKPGNRVGHISQVIEKGIKKAGYAPSLSLVGHGVGKELHEPPQIPCFVREPLKQTPLLKVGMTLAIEVIYSMGETATETEEDGWTIRMKDGNIAAVFEKTIAVTRDGPFVCT